MVRNEWVDLLEDTVGLMLGKQQRPLTGHLGFSLDCVYLTTITQMCESFKI